ncbi:hypothetical protein PAUR_a1057 [Pseudoalteromonas aurantia 208]|uniref:Uncharacterized protein n=1 Tax=Pseudoalteromonas aurantia 208 TaxID=1314867 RepID=A0ABR9EA57_9GAMM|nr:hypothetical protein [Pseudoalteromonas aurantia 208]
MHGDNHRLQGGCCFHNDKYLHDNSCFTATALHPTPSSS